MERIEDRFLRYVSVDTQSNEESESQPSTAKQLNLLKMLCDELQAMGVKAELDEYGYVMGTIPASEFPELLQFVGQKLITTDGTTLLGADDKAGVAEIMNAVEYIVGHPEFKHGEIKVGFTPDEEIGRGVVKFDVKKFGADYAYTMDGGDAGELEYENFNAASATVRIQGRNVHPGYAKGKMKNAILIGMELNALLPIEQRPEYTEGYEGFYHVIGFGGTVEEATLRYIIRT